MPDATLPVRRVVPHLSIEGTAVAGPFAANLLSFTYQDYLTEKADSLDLRIEDTAGRWLSSWAPNEGQRIEASLDLQTEGHGTSTLDCGAFQVDGIGCEGPPSTVTIQATSTSISADLRRTERSQAWENVRLTTIQQQIARRHGLDAVFAGSAAGDPRFERVTQQRSSDLAFLSKLAGEAGLYLRVTRGAIWLGDRESLIEEAELATLTVGEVSRYRFESRGYVRYRACEVTYQRPETRQTVTHTATARPRTVAGTSRPRRPRTPRPPTFGIYTSTVSGATVGEVLRVTRRADTVQDAQRLAEACLAEANRASVRAEVTLPGRPDLVSGVLVDLQGFGSFSGPRLVETAEHTYSRGSGYVTRLTFLDAASTAVGETGTGDE